MTPAARCQGGIAAIARDLAAEFGFETHYRARGRATWPHPCRRLFPGELNVALLGDDAKPVFVELESMGILERARRYVWAEWPPLGAEQCTP